MSAFKDFPGLENLEKEFKDPQEPWSPQQVGTGKSPLYVSFPKFYYNDTTDLFRTC